MKDHAASFHPALYAYAVLLLLGSFFFLGCEGISDDDGENFDPSEGNGALFINNDSIDVRVLTFIDGEQQEGRTGGDNERVYELAPGTYRVVLVDDRDDDVIYREEVDIIANRVLVLDVDQSGVGERIE